MAGAELLFADGTPFPAEVERRTPRTPNPRLPGTSGWEQDWGFADLNCEDVAAWDGYGGTLGLFTSRDGPNTRCPIDYGNFFSIQEGEVLQKIYMTGDYALTDNFEVYFEGGYSEQEFFRLNSLAPQTRTPTIPVHNPALINDANLRGMPVPLVNRSRLLGGTPLTPTHIRPIRTQQDGDRDTFRMVLGATWDVLLGERAWTINASFAASESSQYQYNVEDSRAAEMVLALNGLGGPNCNSAGQSQEWIEANRGSGNRAYTGGNFEDGSCYYLNPFGSGLFDASGNFRDPVGNPNRVTLPDGTATSIANPPELLSWLDGTWQQNDEFEQRVTDIVASGDLFELPAGMVSAAFGYQQRVDTLLRHYDINFRQFNAAFRFGGSNVSGTITTDAFFGELIVPIISDLEAQLAVRRESFEEIDTSTTDPKVSLLWRPTDEWTVRASWGQSFRVGSILQLIGPQTIVSNTNDPFNDTSFFIPWISAGVANLSPEESEALSFGFTYAPQRRIGGPDDHDGPLANRLLQSHHQGERAAVVVQRRLRPVSHPRRGRWAGRTSGLPGKRQPGYLSGRAAGHPQLRPKPGSHPAGLHQRGPRPSHRRGLGGRVSFRPRQLGPIQRCHGGGMVRRIHRGNLSRHIPRRRHDGHLDADCAAAAGMEGELEHQLDERAS